MELLKREKLISKLTKEELVATIKSSRSVSEIVMLWGYSKKSTKVFYNVCKKFNIDYRNYSALNGYRTRGVVWQIDLDVLKEYVRVGPTFSAILSKMGFNNCGGNHRTLKKRLIDEGIDFSHIYKNFPICRKRLTNDQVFRENSTAGRHTAKQRIIEGNLIEFKCCECGLKNEWNKKKLVLVLDHKNGVANDHRLSNLRFLCPNCNSQTDTFAGKNQRIRYRIALTEVEQKERRKTQCKGCGSDVSSKKATLCIPCSLSKKSKIPLKEELELCFAESNWTWIGIGKKYDVCDNAVRKWVKKHKIDMSVYSINRRYSM